jgi:hypothetical protein
MWSRSQILDGAHARLQFEILPDLHLGGQAWARFRFKV